MGEAAYHQEIKGSHFTATMLIDEINKRLRIDDYRGNVPRIVEYVEETAVRLKKEKVIFIARKEHFFDLLVYGFQCEAVVEGFFRGSDAYYLAKYYHNDRRNSDQWLMEDRILQSIRTTSQRKGNLALPKDYQLKKLETSDADKLADLYRNVFQIYPTPLLERDYIVKTMKEGTLYYGVIYEGDIVSAASAEINDDYRHAELTDCATLTGHRKFSLMKRLLEQLGEELRQKEIYCAFSIARAQSFGMNAVLYQLGYHYRGRLTNNCYIFAELEDMNMWVKNLSE